MILRLLSLSALMHRENQGRYVQSRVRKKGCGANCEGRERRSEEPNTGIQENSKGIKLQTPNWKTTVARRSHFFFKKVVVKSGEVHLTKVT